MSAFQPLRAERDATVCGMSKDKFWFLVAAWYLLLAGVVAAGMSRFGGNYIARFFAEPSLKTAFLLGMAVLPVPFVVRRLMRA